MKVLGVVLLAGSLMVIGGGCGGSSSAPAGAVSGPAAGEPVGMGQGDNRAGVRLEREGFALLGFHARVDEYDRVYVVGEIQNVGTAARGVELQATLRDADGQILAVGHFYPASHNNVEPGQKWPFAYSFGRQEEAVEAELRIVGAFRTIDVANVAYLHP